MFAFTFSGVSPLNSQNSECSTSGQYHQSMESASPTSNGKMMPSAGKGSKPLTMTSLIRNNATQQQQPQQSVYYNAGSNSSNCVNPSSGYAMGITQPQQVPQSCIPSTKPVRYASQGGKPIAYGQTRVSYPNEPYMIGQPIPSSLSSSLSHPCVSNPGK